MNVKQFYIDVNGDYNKALSLMMNDILIAKLLGKFIANNSCDQLISAYENKNYREVFTASHALKGVAGNLALTPLFDLASSITEATRNSDDVNIDKEVDELKKIYQIVKDSYSKNIA